jgi:hypothetical protein
MPLFQQYFNYIVAVSFIGGGNWRKPFFLLIMTFGVTNVCILTAGMG